MKKYWRECSLHFHLFMLMDIHPYARFAGICAWKVELCCYFLSPVRCTGLGLSDGQPLVLSKAFFPHDQGNEAFTSNGYFVSCPPLLWLKYKAKARYGFLIIM